MLIAILGLPGTGKTYFAQKLAEKLSAPHFNTDQVRAELNAKGQYDEATKHRVYEQLFQKVADALEKHSTVIVDATFSKKDHRERFDTLMQQREQAIYYVELTADEDTIRRRLSHPREDSEADFSVYQQVKDSFQPLEQSHLVLNSGRQSAEEMIRQTLTHLSL